MLRIGANNTTTCYVLVCRITMSRYWSIWRTFVLRLPLKNQWCAESNIH